MSNEITINALDYLSPDEIKQEAIYVIRKHFTCEIEKSNLPYKVFYEAVKESGLDFTAEIKEKIEVWGKEKSTFGLTDSQAFKDAMKKTIHENADVLRSLLLKRIEEMDSYDIREQLADAMIKILERK